MKIINLYLKKCACLDASTTLPLHVEGVIRRNSPLQNTTITIIRSILSKDVNTVLEAVPVWSPVRYISDTNQY